VILWREGPEGREVFWVRRGDGLRFGGGFHAFPGGAVDEGDRRVPVHGLEGEEAARLAAAVRELFEEAGVLLARGSERLSRERRDEARRALLDRRMVFADLLLGEGLALDPSLLDRAGHWITPDGFPIRFDAWFYLARTPAGQEPEVWPGELSSGGWVATGGALARWERGEALLHPPALWSLRALDREGPPAVLERLRHRAEGPLIEFQRGVVLAALRTPTLPPATHTNCWLVEVEGGVAVVDPGASDPAEQARLDAILTRLAAEGRPAREAWITHAHLDHVGGAAALAERGLPMRAHPLVAGALPRGAAVRTLSDGELLHGRWRVLHTPGHARGHVCFHDEVTGALLAGDMVSTLSTIVIDPPEGDMGEYLRQLARLRRLGARNLFPAHGPAAPAADARLDEYLRHRRMRTEKVAAALSPGGTLAEVTRAAYDDTPDWLLPVAERSCLATLVMLREEGRAVLSGGLWGPK
jgi:glyoxylase-like metal-dependent hydrolase (beta-lactamase superfamily II)/8-oxo-dGTP pyrophosphatase MutT (NUDIX family)